MVQGWSAFILEVLLLKIAGRGRQEMEGVSLEVVNKSNRTGGVV
jgi:hypothetical protein